MQELEGVYFNDVDVHSVVWLKELVDNRCFNVCPEECVIDGRSVLDIEANDVRGYEQCHFFAGIGGWRRAFDLANVDVRDLCNRYGGAIWTASLPCQPFSVAGARKCADDERHLWPIFRELVAECRPAIIFGEQVASKDGKDWLSGIRNDLEEMGYVVGAADLCAASVNAPHIRQRIYWGAFKPDSLANPDRGYIGIPTQLKQRYASLHNTNGCVVINGPACRLGNSKSREECSEEGSERSDNSKYRGSDGISGLAHSSSLRRNGRGEEGTQSKGLQCATRHDGDSQRLGSPNLQRQQGYGERSYEHVNETLGECVVGETGLVIAGNFHRPNFWEDYSIVPCRDPQKSIVYRRIPKLESGIFPLVNGLPRGMGYVRDKRIPITEEEANATSEARTARIRGYGNAIVPQLAALFVESMLESVEDLKCKQKHSSTRK